MERQLREPTLAKMKRRLEPLSDEIIKNLDRMQAACK